MGIKETFDELFGKGKDFASDVAAQAGDLANTAGLKARAFDKGLEHDKLMKELGVAVYETVKDDPALVAANAELFEKIAANLQARQQLEDELSDIEARAQARRADGDEAQESAAQAEPDYSTGYRTATNGANEANEG